MKRFLVVLMLVMVCGQAGAAGSSTIDIGSSLLWRSPSITPDVFFSGCLGLTHTVTASTAYQVTFASLSVDPWAMADVGFATFTIPISGRYEIVFSPAVGALAAQHRVFVTKNGAVTNSLTSADAMTPIPFPLTSGITTKSMIPLKKFMKLVAGDRIGIVFIAGQTADVTGISDGQLSQLLIRLDQ